MRLKTEDKKWRSAAGAFCLFLFSVFICLGSELSVFSNGISSTDSSVFRYVAWMMRQGYVPYRDTFDHKGPLIYFIDYLGMAIHPVRGIWLIEIAAIYTGMIFSCRTVRLFASGKTALLTVVIAYALLGDCYKGGNMTEEYAIPFIAVSLYFFFKYFYLNRIGNAELLVCGFCFAAVCFLRVNMIAVWMVCIPAVLFHNLKNHMWKETGRQVLFFSCGCLVLTLPIVCYLLLNRAFADFWNTYLVFNFSYTGYQDLRTRLECYRFFTDQPMVCLAVFGLLYAWYEGRRKKDAGATDVWCTAVAAGCFILTFPLMCMSGRNDITYEMVLIPVLILPVGFLVRSVLERGEGAVPITSCFIMFWIVTMVTLPLLWKAWDKNLERNRYLSEQKDESWLSTVLYMADTYCDDDDTISVFGNKDSIYLLCGRLSASRYSYQFPLVEVRRDIYQEYLAELERNNPGLIVIDESFAGEYEYIFREWLTEHSYEAADEEETIYFRSQPTG